MSYKHILRVVGIGFSLFLNGCGGSGGTEPTEVTPSVSTNTAPAVNAGFDTTINLPGLVSLSASATDDGEPAGGSLSTSWSQVSGPGTVSFTDAAALMSNASFSLSGRYVLRLSASDTDKISSDEVTVTVNPAIEVGSYVLKGRESLSVDRKLPSTPESNISYSVPDASTGLTVLSAPAGTFEANAALFIINLSVERKHLFVAGADGSLSGAEIFAPYGSELLIRVKYTPSSSEYSALSADESTFLQTRYSISFADISDDESMRSVTGFRLKIMPSVINPGEFYGLNLMHDDVGNAIPRSVQGTLAATSGLSASSTPALSFNMRLFGTGSVTSPGAEFKLKPTHDALGMPLGTTSRFVTTQMDASGTALSSSTNKRNSLIESLPIAVTSSDTNGINYSLSTLLDFTAYQANNAFALVNGHYMLSFSVGEQGASLTPAATITGTQTLVAHADDNLLLLPVSIGSVAAAQEPLVFFLDANPDGYIGLFDQTNFPNFGLNFVAHMATKGLPVLNRYRPDGSLRKYNFAPFIPRFSVADRNTPSVALMAIDAKNSAITIILTTPTTTINLPTVSGNYLRHVHNKNLYRNSRSNGGVHMTDILQMVLNDTNNDYTRSFSESGQHAITVTGSLQTIEGKTLSINQTMDFVVTDYLVTPHYSTLPMMPLQSGEVIRPMLTLMPAIPANVDIKITYAPNSETPTVTSFSGVANHAGVFVAATEMSFTQAGEYRVDIQVNHTDSNGNHYAGSRSFGSVVADASPQVNANGKRGIDNMQDSGVIPNRWFSRDALGLSHSYVVGTGHTLAPYEHGDIEWVEADISGVVRASLSYNSVLAAIGADCIDANLSAWATTSELSIADCVPSSFGRPIINSVPSIGFSAHSYNAVERFSIRVRESVGDYDAHGYWRFDDEYGHQRGVGTAGDKTDELKFQYIGTVVKDHVNTKNHYSSHASLFVLTADDDIAGNDTRVFPPFDGHGIQPGGGAIITLGSRNVAAFVWPTSLIPGSSISQGDVIPFYGQIAPTLPLTIDLTITKPDATVVTVTAIANKDGFVRTSDIHFDQAGLYTIKPTLTYSSGQSTSAGQLVSDIVTTHALLGVNDHYHIYVSPKPRQSLPININLATNPSLPETINLAANPVFRVVSDRSNNKLTNLSLHSTVFMDGWILDQSSATATDVSDLSYTLDLSTLEQTFNTIDIGDGILGRENTYTDLIRISFMLTGTDANGAMQSFVRTLTLDGENVLSN